MEDKESIRILLELIKKPLTEKEREALKKAIGALSWTTLAESKIKNRKNKKLL